MMTRSCLILTLALVCGLPLCSGNWLDYLNDIWQWSKKTTLSAEEGLEAAGQWIKNESIVSYEAISNEISQIETEVQVVEKFENAYKSGEKGLKEATGWVKKKGEDVLTGLSNDVAWVEEEADRIASELPSMAGSCVCAHYSCGCCVHMDVKELELNSTACLNLTYLYKDYGISLTLTLNNYTLYNETISAHNPPPICVKTPLIPELADICIRLYDVSVSKVSFHGCLKVEARMKHILVAKYDLGCFTIGGLHLGIADNNILRYMNENMTYPSVVLV